MRWFSKAYLLVNWSTEGAIGCYPIEKITGWEGRKGADSGMGGEVGRAMGLAIGQSLGK